MLEFVYGGELLLGVDCPESCAQELSGVNTPVEVVEHAAVVGDGQHLVEGRASHLLN